MWYTEAIPIPTVPNATSITLIITSHFNFFIIRPNIRFFITVSYL